MAALLGLAQALYLQGLDDRTGSFMAQWLATCERALELARELGDRHGIVRALLMMVWKIDYWPETIDEAREHADEALRLARTLGDEGLLVQARIAAYATRRRCPWE